MLNEIKQTYSDVYEGFNGDIPILIPNKEVEEKVEQVSTTPSKKVEAKSMVDVMDDS